MVIMLLALIVLGPQKLPDAARSLGRFTSEVRRMSNGFRAEMKAALDAETADADADTEAAARARGAALTARPVSESEPVGEPEPAVEAETAAEPEPADEP